MADRSLAVTVRLHKIRTWLVAGILAVLALAILSLEYSRAATATLGYTSQGGATDAGDSNFMNGSRFVMSGTGGVVSSMSVYVAGPIDTGTHNQYQLAIYTDSSGSPATLVATSASGTLAGNSWNTLPVNANLNPSTAYWLMYNANGTKASVNDMKYAAGGSGQGAFSTKSQPFGTWPATF